MALELDPKTIGDRVRARREALGLSQDELGQAVGTKHLAISRIELGKVSRPQLPTIAGIARALDVPLDWIVFGVEPASIPGKSGPPAVVELAIRREGASAGAAERLRAIQWGDVEPGYSIVRDLMLDLEARYGTGPSEDDAEGGRQETGVRSR